MNHRTASSWLTINLKAVAANYNIIREKAGKNTRVAGIVKANAYGLGIEKIGAALESQNCPSYFVATLDEAIKLRSLTRKPIAMLGGLYRGAEDYYIHENVTPVLNSLDDIHHWAKTASGRDVPLPAIIHFDTAMNRLGLDRTDTESLLNDLSVLKPLNLMAIMSHFASADERTGNDTISDTIKAQAKRFKAIAAYFPDTPKSLCNSAGIYCNDPSFYMDIVRPGMALYGLNPTPRADNPMQNVVQLNARILQVRQAFAGESAGYNETYRIERDAVLATVGLGYADGMLRSLSHKGKLYYNNIPCPVIGRISMDAITVDITHLSEKPKPGDALEVIGKHQTADILAKDAGTIAYEILTSLGDRYHRNYI